MSGNHHHHGMAGITVPGDEAYISPDFADVAFNRLVRELQNISDLLEQQSGYVDEVRVQTLAPDSENFLSWPADFERIDVIATSILVVGPVSTAFTLQLGKRVWNLNTTAAGFLVIAPVRMKLNYDDVRSLSTATLGDWCVEVMGYPQVRGKRY